jgi:hypothetical protein
MTAFVVDVNVAIVANGRSPQADPVCVSACVDALINIHAVGKIVLDDGMRILSEYMNHLSMTGQPGMGDAFMQWVWQNQAVKSRCERVHLESNPEDLESFLEFPADSDLQGFDPSDRKYVVVALGSRERPEVLNAVDPDWWEHRVALARIGIRLRFLCLQHMQ